MKFAVIIGVLQMLFGNIFSYLGIFLKMINAVHFKSYIDVFC